MRTSYGQHIPTYVKIMRGKISYMWGFGLFLGERKILGFRTSRGTYEPAVSRTKLQPLNAYFDDFMPS